MMVCRDGSGRLFQMSRPQTANARHLKAVRVRRMMGARVDAERREKLKLIDRLRATR